MKEILKVLVGSQAHGLETPESDFDYRGVFIQPTKDLLRLTGCKKETRWIEGKIDDTSWELGKFMFMAGKCNPTILEAFLAPVVNMDNDGMALRHMFDYVWNSKGVMDSFIGYGLNQRKKFLDNKDVRPQKYAAAYLRSLYNGWELLTTGTFTVRIADTPIGETVRKFKNGEYISKGEVIGVCLEWEDSLRRAYEKSPKKETDWEKINEFVLDIRKKYFQ